jgi:hypothetical protein
LLIALVTASFKAPISISILIYTKLSIFTIGYTITQKPFSKKSENMTEIVNELFIWITGLYMTIFSQWMYDPTSLNENEEYSYVPITVYNYGYLYISFVVIILSFNLSIVASEFRK